MIGYILAVVVGLILLGVVIAGLTRARPRTGRDNPRRGVQVEAPAADAPTPDRSATASPGEIAGARRAIPPA